MHTFNQSNQSKVQIWTRHCSLQIEGHFKVEFPANRGNRSQKNSLFWEKRNSEEKLLKRSSQSKEFNKFFREISLRFRIYWLNCSKYESFLFAENPTWKLQILYLWYTYTTITGMDWIDANSSSPLSSSKEDIVTICYIKNITFSSLFLVQFKNCKDDIR